MDDLEQLIVVYLSLVQALHDGDLEAAAFYLDVAAQAERSAAEADLQAGRALLPPDVVLLLEERGVEQRLAQVRAALEQVEGA